MVDSTAPNLATLAKKLHVACEEGSLTAAREVLEQCPHLINVPNDSGNKPLSIALKSEQSRLFRYLTETGAHVNTTNNAGQTPLQIACWKNMMEEVALLLHKGADVNSQDLRGWTPLMIASQQGNEGTVRMLLKWGANPMQTDRFGKRASDRAKSNQICYLLQSAAVSKHMDSPTKPSGIRYPDKPAPKLSKQKQQLYENNKECSTILAYYREKFMEQVAVLSKALSRHANQQLEHIIQEELEGAESSIRGLMGSELTMLSDRMKKELDQHIDHKLRLTASKLGLDSDPATSSTTLKEVKPKFPIKSPKKIPQAKEELKSSPHTIKRLNRTIDTLIDSKDELVKMVRSTGISPRQLSSEQREMYSYLQREVMLVVGTRINEVAQVLASENRATISGILREKIGKVEESLRVDMKMAVFNMQQMLSDKIEKLVSERFTRTTKQLSTATAEAKRTTLSQTLHDWTMTPEGGKMSSTTFSKFSLQSRMEGAKTERARLGLAEKRTPMSSQKEVKTPMRNINFATMGETAESAEKPRVNYSYVDSHNSRVTPLVSPKADPLSPPANEPPRMSNLLSKYSNIYRKENGPDQSNAHSA